jgi:hypothetical protein
MQAGIKWLTLKNDWNIIVYYILKVSKSIKEKILKKFRFNFSLNVGRFKK